MVERKPDWLRIKIHHGEALNEVTRLIRESGLHTVCEEANCPNLGECFSRRTATFMILGKICTRNCTFCNVQKNAPEPLDPDEPVHVALAIEKLGLKHAVI